jgi:hypothetical protein
MSVKSISSMALFSSRILLLLFVWIFCLLKSGVLSSPTITVSGPICFFIFRSLHFMNLGALMFIANMFRIVLSYCWIVPFTSVQWPSFSLLPHFCIKSALSIWKYLLLLAFHFGMPDKSFFPGFHFLFVHVFGYEMCILLLDAFR